MANPITAPYANFVLENKIADILDTHIDMMSIAKADYSLTESAGMKKTVHVYKAVGNVQDLTEGVGNSQNITAQYDSFDYDVAVTQGRFVYSDEALMKDPTFIETGIKGIADKMANDLSTKVFAEYAKRTLTQEGGFDFNHVVDAIAKYPYESENGLFLVIGSDMKAEFRKNLKDSLEYSEGFARTGYIGSVCGVPVIVSKACDGHAYLADKEAVTIFVKKGVEIENARIANTRTNEVYGRKVMVVALTDATRVIELVDGSH